MKGEATMQNTTLTLQSLTNTLSNALSVKDLITGTIYSKDEDGSFIDADGNPAPEFDNPDLFEVVEAGPQPVPQFSVINGKLSPAVEQGQIQVIDILAAGPGTIYLSVKPLSEKAASAGKVDIMSYKPAEDSFDKLFSEVPAPAVTDLGDGKFLFVINSTEETEVTREDNTKETVLKFLRSSANLIEEGCVAATLNLDAPADEVAQVVAPNGLSETILISASAVEYDEEAGLAVVKPRNGLLVTRLDEDNIEEIGEADLRGIGSIDAMSLDFRGNLLVKAGNLLYYSNDGFRPRFVVDAAVTKTAGYDRLVKLSFEDGGNTARYLLADGRKTITLVDKRTKDRGHIVTVEA